ncbi:hypothetical protein GPX89_21060 [Nocardia sp. ET3-3]|uniref:Uncharacterized protein n=1 Tax=Nocardia terrae TaxID=2675851 RepID=A0A7K1UZB6_9NOCA|nr:hypothetical protein [Nocardia terrae]MVU79720.1 hypothetical protein [Nocardia terrae]
MATPRTRRTIIGGAVTAATALAVLSAAPSASAAVTGITPGTGLAHVNSTYTLTATDFGASTSTVVTFWVGDAAGGALTQLGTSTVNSNGLATISWTPTAVGSGTVKIVASDDGSSTSGNAAVTSVPVTAVPAGSLGTGSASKIPIIGGALSTLLGLVGLA